MTDLIPILAEKFGLKPDTAIHNKRFMRIASHYRREVERKHMSLNTAIDRAYGDICGQNRAEGKLQNTEPRFS